MITYFAYESISTPSGVFTASGGVHEGDYEHLNPLRNLAFRQKYCRIFVILLEHAYCRYSPSVEDDGLIGLLQSHPPIRLLEPDPHLLRDFPQALHLPPNLRAVPFSCPRPRH
jgi:hypothetical protein